MTLTTGETIERAEANRQKDVERGFGTHAWFPLIDQSENLGDAHRVRNQVARTHMRPEATGLRAGDNLEDHIHGYQGYHQAT